MTTSTSKYGAMHAASSVSLMSEMETALAEPAWCRSSMARLMPCATDSPKHPPVAPRGYILVEARTTQYGLQIYKYVRDPKGERKRTGSRLI